jgi:hypothetical protein
MARAAARATFHPYEADMSTKLIACLLAACVVAGGGAYLYHGGSCPFSGGCDKSITASCPTGECSLVKTGVCCDDADACCDTAVKVVAKKSCCSECSESLAKEPMTAAFGGLAVATK